ncbi:phosphate transporter [Burkholderia cenocepacia]|uniref:phosphate transporter n=1 Tax=Burkholderia cenocepacia TaxID=95486 RepID=UPI001CF3F2D5|nr:phosphate transporter [Burkholderia cenocepacia]MCA7962861.1 phosphate transporter [Burkholderia cenocepacia]MDR8053959.1 phosphate transporter [Burkholderia cenocepacia]MDR8064408.1 phosphate transporter [Burkholderia cenocepacia]
MPNLAATDTGGAVGHRTRLLGLALFFPVIACGIVPVGVHSGADLRVVEEGSVLSFALPITPYRVLHGLS